MQCVSDDQIKKIDIADRTKAFVTKNCVDTDFFMPQLVKRENFLLFLGRLNHSKGIDIAVSISKDTGIPLKIAGPVQEKDEFAEELYNEKVKPFLNDQIEHIGEVNDFQKRSLLSRAKGLIVPNRWDEPCGQVIIEALACGTPIIGTNKGSLKEMIIGNKTGILCNNYGELIDATRNIKFLSNKECRKDACNRFSLEKYTNDTEKIYQNILNKY